MTGFEIRSGDLQLVTEFVTSV